MREDGRGKEVLQRLRILLLTPQLPYPPQQGTSLRNFHIIRGLAERHAVHLLSFVEETESSAPAGVGPLQELCQTITTVPVPRRTLRQRVTRLLTDARPDMAHRLQSSAFEVRLRELLAQVPFDVVQVEGIELAPVLPTVRQLQPRARLVFDDHNAEAALQASAFYTDLRLPRRWPAAAYSLIQMKRLAGFESWACRRADAVTAVSEADARALQSLAPEVEVVVVPNCIDVDAYKPLPGEEVPTFDVVFSGKMDYRPNVDAVLWFGREIWPQIRMVRPETTWAIVGQKPHSRLTELRQLEGVTITGRVARVEPFLAGARVYVVPLRMGSGTRLKLLEAMASGRALVSTPLGAEGFPVRHGKELLLAAEAESFAEAVLYLLGHPEERAALGTSATRFANAYDWRVVVPAFEDLYARLME